MPVLVDVGNHVQDNVWREPSELAPVPRHVDELIVDVADLRRETAITMLAMENRDVMAAPHQFPHHERTNEARSSKHQHAHTPQYRASIARRWFGLELRILRLAESRLSG